MVGNDGILRSVAWSELFPCLNLFRTVRLATNFRVLLLGALGIIITLHLWTLWAWVFGVTPEHKAWMAPAKGCPWMAVDAAVADDIEKQLSRTLLPAAQDWPAAELSGAAGASADTPWHGQGGPVFGVWRQLTQPALAGFNPSVSKPTLLCLFLCGLTSLAVWAFFGGAIARIAVVQLASDERVGIVAALRFACRKWLSFFAAPLIPLIGLVVAAVPVWICGLLMNIDFGIFVVSLIWPVLLLFGFIMAMLAIGLLFAWPLMWATIAAEGTDSFDALSRSYAYLFQRPLRYALYALLAAVLGALGWWVVQLVAAAVVGLTYSAAGWGAGQETLDKITPAVTDLEGIGYAGAMVIRFWATVVKLLAVGFLYGFFWTAVSSIYLLLRRDVDATEMDEVFLDADESELAPPLTPITADAQGAPVMSDAAAPGDSDEPQIVPEETPGPAPLGGKPE